MAINRKPAHSFSAHPLNDALCSDCYHSKGWHTDGLCWICNQGPAKGVS